MEISEAQAAVASTTVSTVSETRSRLASFHAEFPQKVSLAHLALNSIEAGLAQLASLGHQFGLVENPKLETDEWPKMMYRDGPQGLEQQVVASEDAADKLGPEWRDKQQVAANMSTREAARLWKTPPPMTAASGKK